MNEKEQRQGHPKPTPRSTVRLGRRFAGSLAVRLDAHPTTGDGARAEEERRLLELIREVLTQPDPEPSTVNFLTQAVEMHTQAHGFSKAIYDELFNLHQTRARRVRPAAPTEASQQKRPVPLRNFDAKSLRHRPLKG